MYDKNGEKSHEIVINLIFKTANYMKRTKATEKKQQQPKMRATEKWIIKRCARKQEK